MAKKKAAVKKVEGKVGLKKKTSKKATKKKGAVKSNLLVGRKFPDNAQVFIVVTGRNIIAQSPTELTMEVEVAARGPASFNDFDYQAAYQDIGSVQWRSNSVVPKPPLGVRAGAITIIFKKVRVGLDETLVDDELVVTILTSKSNRA